MALDGLHTGQTCYEFYVCFRFTREATSRKFHNYLVWFAIYLHGTVSQLIRAFPGLGHTTGLVVCMRANLVNLFKLEICRMNCVKYTQRPNYFFRPVSCMQIMARAVHTGKITDRESCRWVFSVTINALIVTVAIKLLLYCCTMLSSQRGK